MKRTATLLTIIALMTLVSVAFAQNDSPLPPPDVPVDEADGIVSDVNDLVEQAGLGSLVSLLVMALTYFNIVPDGWGGKIYFGTGVFVFVVTLGLSTDDANYVFNLLRELTSLLALLLGGVGTNGGLRYLEMLPGRRG